MAEDEINESRALDVEDDLLALIQDDGLTEARLEIFGEKIKGAYFSGDLGYVREKVVLNLEDMEQDRNSIALSYALGISSKARALSDRRSELKVQKGFQVSDDTLRRWERRAMRVLSKRLVADGIQLLMSGQQARDFDESARYDKDALRREEGLRALVDAHEGEIKDLRQGLLSTVRALNELRDNVEMKAGGSFEISESSTEDAIVYASLREWYDGDFIIDTQDRKAHREQNKSSRKLYHRHDKLPGS
jgi:hypothetical protein